MKKLQVLLLSVVTLLTGCAQQQYVSQRSPTQINMYLTQEKIESGMAYLKACNENIRNPKIYSNYAEAYMVVDSSVIFANDNSPNKVSLMASDAKITEPQKKALLVALSGAQLCREIIKDKFGSLPSLLSSFENSYGDMDIVYANLMSKKITIGQANQERAKLIAKAKNEYANAMASMNSQYNQQINQENQARQAENMQRRAIAAQYLMNQQAINAQQQINQQNQLNNRRPVQTDCYSIGISVSCTSQ